MSHVPPAVALCFLSGGTALRETVGALADAGVRTGHVLSPFDSGGSSGALRTAFGVPAIGDVRNRLLSLSRGPHRAAVLATLGRRLPGGIGPDEARSELRALVDTARAGGSGLPDAIATPLADALTAFLALRPRTDGRLHFDRASIGNLVLVGEHLGLGVPLDDTIARWADRLGVDAALTLCATADAHLAATLPNGERLVGQASFTAKRCEENRPGVTEVEVCDATGAALEVPAHPAALALFERAERICLPIGSLWSSVLAHLLPRGMGRALLASRARRIYVPNPGWDAEQGTLAVADVVERIAALCGRDAGAPVAPGDCIDTVVLAEEGAYPSGVDEARLYGYGLEIVRAPLGTARRLDGEALAALLSALPAGR